MAAMVNAGHDPRTIAEEFVKHLRNGFLALMAPELVQLPSTQVDDLATQAQRLGAAALVAAIERLGTIMIELRHAPDPRVLVEVALVQLTRQRGGDAGGHDVDGLAARIAKLENAVASAPAASSVAPAPVDPATGRTKLGGRAQRGGDTAPATAPATASATPSSPPTAEPGPPAPTDAVPAPAAPAVEPAPAAPTTPSSRGGDLRAEWFDQVRPSLRGLAKALFAAVEFVSAGDDSVVLAAPNATHRERSQAHIAEVENAWRDTTGRTVRISWSDSAGASAESRPSRPSRPEATSTPERPPINEPEFDELDAVDESRPAITGNQSVLDRLAEAFPGAERVAEPVERER
jgi:DNA polymerase-3 subunit gamma/tau